MNETAMPSPSCEWCGEGISASDRICPHCTMPISQAVPEKVEEKPKQARKKSKDKDESEEPVIPAGIEDIRKAIDESRAKGIKVAAGIDPGARYTAISIRDNHDRIYLSSTYRRPDEMEDGVEWNKLVVKIATELLANFDLDILGIEGVADPTGFKYGKRDALNPKDIIRTALVVGGLSIRFDGAFIVRPRGNGDKPDDYYPAELTGRRPAWLPGHRDPGVGVRKHEKSAYDVAGHALFHLLHEKEN